MRHPLLSPQPSRSLRASTVSDQCQRHWHRHSLHSGYCCSSTSYFAGINTISATTSLLSVTGSSTITGQLNAVGGATFGSVTAGATNVSSLTLSNLNGPLDARNGVVSATTSIGVLYGGTGLTTAPTYGKILVGNSAGGYTLTATSSLGLLASTSIQAQGPLSFNTSTGVFSISQSGPSTDGYLSQTDWNAFNNAFLPVPSHCWDMPLSHIRFRQARPRHRSCSCFDHDRQWYGNWRTYDLRQLHPPTGNAYFASNVGIGTTSPFATLSVVGTSRFKSSVNSANAFVVENAAGTPTFQISTLDTSANIFSVASSTGQSFFEITSNGNVGVGTTSPRPALRSMPLRPPALCALFALKTPTTLGLATTSVFSVGANGSTTLFQIPSSLLKTDSGGTIIAAVAGVDYATPANISAAFDFTPGLTSFGATANATGTVLLFTQGISASSTSHFAGISTISATTSLLSVTVLRLLPAS